MNLALEILGRRADGFHEIVTVMQAVELADRIVLEDSDALDLRIARLGRRSPSPATSGGSHDIRTTDREVPRDASNLALRAALALRQAAGVEDGVRITLDKRIPVAAGLGGGSADAAAVLLGLNRLWRLRWPLQRLTDVAMTLGMDVPFFLRGGTAFATGRGEKVGRVPGMALALVLVNPRFASSTAEAYGQLTPAMYSDGARARAVVAALGSRHAKRVAQSLYNGLEATVAPAHPAIEQMKAALLAAGALGALMSGSGPTVFGIARSLDHARQIRRRVQRASWECWAVRTLAGPSVRVRGRS